MTRRASAKRKKETRGAIDLGSSYFRLLVVEGVFREGSVLDACSREERIYIGWGKDLSRRGAVTDQSAGRAAAALRNLVVTARSLGCESPSVVATNMLRRSSNGAATASRLEKASGLSVRILSGEEESRLGFSGACTLARRGEPAVLADTGGTSTEIAWGSAPVMDGFLSVEIGTHLVAEGTGGAGGGGMSQRMAASRVEERLKRAVTELRAPRSVSSLPRSGEGHNIIFTGGTAVSLAIISDLLEGSGRLRRERTPMTADRARLLMRRTRGLLRSGRGRTLPLEPQRVALFPAGTALLEGLLRVLRADRFDIVTRDLRWGVLLERG